MIVGAFVLPDVTCLITDASATRKFRKPFTLEKRNKKKYLEYQTKRY